MSDYEFRCPECKKITNTHSTGEAPKYCESVECMSCGRISIVQSILSVLIVEMSNQKASPTKIEKLEELMKKNDAKSEQGDGGSK